MIEVEDFGLLHPIYPIGTMKIGGMNLTGTKTLVICPNCLKPGNHTELFGPFVVGIWRITIPISTHRECSSGWSKRNISGSARVWADGGSICFDFKNPVYAMLFSRINFLALNDSGGRQLVTRYGDELGRLIRVQEQRQKILGSCPRCRNDLYDETDECPSCGLSRRTSWVRMTPTPIEDSSESGENGVAVIKCSHCDIMMLKESRLTTCGKCGKSLKAKDKTESKDDQAINK